nr:helix-turn-helix transcriptional regulator [Clostridia bacterium]
MNINVVGAVRIPVIDLIKTGKNIKRIREASGISVRDIQNILGFTNPQAIYKWQNGECLPTIDNLVILAAVLGVTVDEILVTDDDEDPGDGEVILKSSIISVINAQW